MDAVRERCIEAMAREEFYDWDGVEPDIQASHSKRYDRILNALLPTIAQGLDETGPPWPIDEITREQERTWQAAVDYVRRLGG